MARIAEASGTGLLDGIGGNPGRLSLHRINGRPVAAWPHVLDVGHGLIEIGAGGDVVFEPAAGPYQGANPALRTARFTFTATDGVSESPVYLAEAGQVRARTTGKVVTVDSADEIRDLFREWTRDWAGSARKLGLNDRAGRVVEAAPGAYGALEFREFQFPERVTLRSADRRGGARASQAVFNRCRNIEFSHWTVMVEGKTSGISVKQGSEAIILTRNDVYGSPTHNRLGGQFGIELEGRGGRPNHVVIRDNAIRRFRNNLIKVRRADHVLIEGNVFDEPGQDDMQIKNATHVSIINNWSTVDPLAGPKVHMDFIQFTKDGKEGPGVTNAVVRGNVIGDWRFSHPGKKPFRQCAQFGAVRHDNVLFEQNIFVGGNPNGLNFTRHSRGAVIRNNLFISMQGTGQPFGPTIRLKAPKTPGTVVRGNVEQRPERNFDSMQVGAPGRDYQRLFGHLRHPGDPWLLIGVGGDASDLYPMPGGGLHWADGTGYGPAERFREIFEAGLHPGAVGWPVAGLWNYGHNRHGRVNSR